MHTRRLKRWATLAGVGSLCVLASAQSDDPAARAKANLSTARMSARHSSIARIDIVQQRGARPRFAPDGSTFVFDRENDDRFFDLYMSDLQGKIVGALTEGRSGLPQRNNGNGRFDPSGRFVVFVSEEDSHYGMSMRGLGNPGIGLFSNLRASRPDGTGSWRLTDTPIKKNLFDRTAARAVVNPVFSPDGRTLVWTERYAAGGNNNWGRWRLKAADFSIRDGQAQVQRERDLYTPTGSYATAMGFLDARRLLFAGNPDGQHEYGMDQYILDLETKRLTNLTNSPDVWEEGSCIAPNGRIVYMTNVASTMTINFKDPYWDRQPTERDYYIMNSDGSNKDRITFFNDPAAPEYLGGRAIVAACDISRDGRFLGGTLGVDVGKGKQAELVLKVILVEFKQPLRN